MEQREWDEFLERVRANQLKMGHIINAAFFTGGLFLGSATTVALVMAVWAAAYGASGHLLLRGNVKIYDRLYALVVFLELAAGGALLVALPW